MNTRQLLTVAAAAALGLTAAQAADRTAASERGGVAARQDAAAAQGDPSRGMAGQRAKAAVAEQDRDFVQDAVQSGVAELKASKMALAQAASPAVKQFADRMVQDHTKANQRLLSLARSRGIDVEQEASLLQRGKLELVEHAGKDFDASFIDHFGVDAHKNAVELFQKQARQGKDHDLVAFARETLPKLQEHLRMARDLQQSLQARRDADDKVGRDGRKGAADDRRTQGNGPAPAVQNQSARVSDTGVAPPAVDHRTPGRAPQGTSGK